MNPDSDMPRLLSCSRLMCVLLNPIRQPLLAGPYRKDSVFFFHRFDLFFNSPPLHVVRTSVRDIDVERVGYEPVQKNSNDNGWYAPSEGKLQSVCRSLLAFGLRNPQGPEARGQGGPLSRHVQPCDYRIELQIAYRDDVLLYVGEKN